MDIFKLPVIALTFAVVSTGIAAAQVCTPYEVGGFITGEVSPLNKTTHSACNKRNSNNDCVKRTYKTRKNGFDYTVTLTPDTLQVVEIIGENKEKTGNREDFNYFENLISQKYGTPAKTGDLHAYSRVQKRNWHGVTRSFTKNKSGETHYDFACWGDCPSENVDVDRENLEINQSVTGADRYDRAMIYAKGTVLDVANNTGLSLQLRRTKGKQKLTIHAKCPALMAVTGENAAAGNRTGEF